MPAGELYVADKHTGELIDTYKIPGVSGIHVMAYRQEKKVADIIRESGVLKGRQPWQKLRREPLAPAVAAAGR